MDYGGTAKLREEVDFKQYFDQFNEECTVQFMIDKLSEDLHSLKPSEVYGQIRDEVNIAGPQSINDINKLNIARLHQNECDILQKNLEYLTKLRK